MIAPHGTFIHDVQGIKFESQHWHPRSDGEAAMHQPCAGCSGDVYGFGFRYTRLAGTDCIYAVVHDDPECFVEYAATKDVYPKELEPQFTWNDEPSTIAMTQREMIVHLHRHPDAYVQVKYTPDPKIKDHRYEVVEP